MGCLMVRRLGVVLALGLTLLGCKTITEELPTAPTSGADGPVVNVPLPVTVTPIALPQPETPAPAATPTTGGTPTSTPEPEGNDDDSDEFIPDNTAPVARVTAKVFFVECNGEAVPGSEGAQTAEVGCRVHLDTTPKDAAGKPTQSKDRPRWFYSDQSAFTIGGGNPFTPVLQVKARGSTSIHSVIDGVQSNTLFLRFQ
jgi:hypothetical protein